MFRRLFFPLLPILLLGCTKDNLPSDKIDQLADTPLFISLPYTKSKVDFINTITETEDRNVFVYEYFYNGGGVAVGDVNNDGLDDLYFTGNQVSNRLYLNLGNLEFKDVTEESGLTDDGSWSTGATFADVNNDGFVDLYVCNSELYGNRANKLYINQRDGTFSEQAKAYGLDDQGFSTHATFFDYDKDGDLDMYLVNHSPLRTLPIEVQQKARREKPQEIADQFYRNEGGERFVNISQEAGVTPYYSFGLSATSGDVNGDGWTDVYVTNDYDETDLLLINQKNSRFANAIKYATKHISLFGMGADIADFNNDLLPDIMVADMTAADNRRQKLNMASMNPALFWKHIELGYHYQYMHNTLQHNFGNDENGRPIFGEIAQLSGVQYTDWSWSVLLEDFDNDSWKDLLVTNGYLHLRDNDFKIRLADKKKELARELTNLEKVALLSSDKITNYAFRNQNGEKFTDYSKAWGLDLKGFSNGASFADLDNDGDLDYIINNINDRAAIFENRANNLGTNYYLQVALSGQESNSKGIGAKVYVTVNGQVQYKEVMNTRGYLSSVGTTLHFGLGPHKIVDQLKVVWPSGKIQTLSNVTADQYLVLSESAATKIDSINPPAQKLFVETEVLTPPFIHRENDYDDFEKEVLLPHKMSTFGPALATGDLNNDGLDDIFLGGASNLPGSIYHQVKDGYFELDKQTQNLLNSNKVFEDVAAAIFDVNNDGRNDLYIVSGGNEHKTGAKWYQDRLLIQTAQGLRSVPLPTMPHPGS